MYSPPNGEDGSLEDGAVEMEDNTTVAKLRRLASTAEFAKTSKSNIDASQNFPGITDIRISAAGNAANKIQDILNKPSANRADIRKFVEKEYHKSSAFKELVRHMIFLVILLAGVTLHRSVYESYLLNQALLTSFVTQQIDASLQPFPKTFMDIGQPDEFSDWFTNVLGGTLDQTTFYNGQNMTAEEQNYIMFSNRLIGGVRIRQLRNAKNRNCKAPHQLREISHGVCFDYEYSDKSRDTEPFGPPSDPEKYVFSTAEQTGSAGFFGYILNYLDGGGYVVDVNIEDKLNGSTYTDAFQELVDEMWFDRQTRAIIISLVFINLELDSRVGVLYLIVEIPGNGVFFPNYMIKTFRLDMYVTAVDYFRLCLEVFFALFVLFSVYTEISEIITNYRTRQWKGVKKYFYNGWNIIELVDIILYIAVMVLYVIYLASPERYESKLDSTVYTSAMERLASTALGFYNVLAFNVILTTFRTFKYLKLNRRLYMLWKTLRHAGIDLMGFIFIFLIFIFGFIFMGSLSFGSDLDDYNTLVHSFATNWNFIIGNAPDYDSMFASNRVLGPTYFVLFTIFIFFILANMFIAILSNSFDQVNENDGESKKLKHVFEEKIAEMSTALKKFYHHTIRKKSQKKRPITEILDNLAHPEILDQPKITRSDVARAIGDGATEGEIDDLHEWVKKLETRRQKRGTVSRNSAHGLIANDYDDGETSRSLSKSTGQSPGFPSPSMHPDETKSTLKEMQAQMNELKQMLKMTFNSKDSNKND